jgi:hypothetical protein
VNRALPDTELDGFVDALARRIASFDHRAMRRRISSIRSIGSPGQLPLALYIGTRS